MGLTIILSIIIFLFIVFSYDTSHKQNNGNIMSGLFTVLCNMVISFGISLIITYVVTVIAIGVVSEKEDSLVMVDRQIEELQEFAPNLYVITGVGTVYRGPDYAKVTVLVNDETQNIHLQAAKIILNSSEHMIETRKYDFANPILRWLLFDPQVKEHDIYTPQSSLDGAFKIK